MNIGLTVINGKLAGMGEGGQSFLRFCERYRAYGPNEKCRRKSVRHSLHNTV